MSCSRSLKSAVTVLGLGFAGVAVTPASASPPSGVAITNYVTVDLEAGDHLNSDRIKFQTKGPTDLRVQQLSFSPGGSTGWHYHPGMVIVTVASGTLTVWESDCSKTDYGPGSPNGAAFIEALPHAHQATSADGASVYVTYVVPDASPPVFRVEQPVPFCAQPGF